MVYINVMRQEKERETEKINALESMKIKYFVLSD